MRLSIVRALLTHISISDLLVYIWQVTGEASAEKAEAFRAGIERAGWKLEWRKRSQ